MAKTVKLTSPLTDQDVLQLNIGDKVLVSGVIYTARDAAHKRLVDLLAAGRALAHGFSGADHVLRGPQPGATRPGYRRRRPHHQLPHGLLRPHPDQAGFEGDDRQGQALARGHRRHARTHKAVYLGATGGAGALISQRIKAAEVIAFPELGPEAVHRLEVEDLPAIVINDCQGRDLYEARGQGVSAHRRTVDNSTARKG